VELEIITAVSDRPVRQVMKVEEKYSMFVHRTLAASIETISSMDSPKSMIQKERLEQRG